MSEAKHSDGPWTTNSDDRYVVMAADGFPVAMVSIGFGRASRTDLEALANARLMASAPDLLAACQAVAESHWSEIGAKQLGDLRDQCRAAIAKAVAP